jgi:hypothetical protein
MTQDHFVSQTYLTPFCDTNAGGKLHAYRKANGTVFHPSPHGVCKERDGDLNSKFIPHRPELLGDLRSLFEPHWPQCVKDMFAHNISADDRWHISCAIANFMACTPTWRDIGAGMATRQLAGHLSFAKAMQAKHGGNPDLPVEAIQALEQDQIHIDPDYIKCIQTKMFLDLAWATYNQNWDVIFNATDCPFLTSDNPFAYLTMETITEPVSRVLPVTPQLCLRITYDIREAGPLDLSKRHKGGLRFGHINADSAQIVNRFAVMCADRFVFSSIDSPDVANFVRKYGDYRIVEDYVELPGEHEDSMYQCALLRIRKR